jgi:hypothetical protein
MMFIHPVYRYMAALALLVIFLCVVAETLFPLWVSILCGVIIGLLVQVRQRPSIWDERE